MPNWVTNKVTLDGSREDLAKAREQLNRTHTVHGTEVKDPIFSFWNITHPPEEKWEIYNAVSDASADPRWGWYAWNSANWGTKWDAKYSEIFITTDEKLVYRFDTAWAPPMTALSALSIQYPDVLITNEWEEEQGFGGTYEFRNGVATETDSYDIPDSHAEMIERRGECWCDDVEDDENPFTDCPSTDTKFHDGVIVSGTPISDVEVLMRF